MKQCSSCGCELPDDARFCVRCGKKAPELSSNTTCKTCGNTLQPNAVFCTFCGAKIERPGAPSGDVPEVPDGLSPVSPDACGEGGHPAPDGSAPSGTHEAAGAGSVINNLSPTSSVPETAPENISAASETQAAAEGQTVPAQTKSCTKCGEELESSVLFCKKCGTKQYLWIQPPSPRTGELLMEFKTCQYIRLQLMKQAGVLSVYDDRLYFQPASGTSHMLLLSEIIGVVPASTLIGSNGFRINTKKGKSYTYGFEAPEQDSVPYLMGLLMNYKD